MTTLSFAEKLILLRRKHKISQKKLATLLNINVNNIPRYENGEYLPGAEILIKMREIFSVSIDYLLVDSQQNPSLLEVNDHELTEIINKADKLSTAEKNRFKNIMNSFLSNNV
jgi:transcriptional regulator with XRE-family HTH domain